MASYEILWKRSAVKELKQLPKESVKKIIGVVAELSDDPLPAGVKKLAGSDHTYRIRVGDYRVIYSIQSHQLLVEITGVGHRREIYR